MALTPCLTCLSAAELGLPGQQMQTPVRLELLDRAVFAEWDRDQEQPPRSEEAQRGPEWILWTTGTRPGHSGLKFGESRQPGPRHLRIGFTQPLPVGSVLTRGNVRVSLLREQAEYPGELAGEDQWLPGQRLVAGRIASHQATEDEYALWVFPPGTATRALRFTHEARPADVSYHGWLGGAMVLKDRLLNLAPQGVVATSASGQKAALLNNGLRDGWNTWQNLDERDALLEQRPVISPEHPEPILLSWSTEVELSGLLALWTGFGSVEIQAWRGPASRHPRDASDADWETLQSYSGFESGYPATLWPNEFRFPQPVRTKAVRLRITGVTPAGHPHVQNRPAGGKRVWLGELMALTNLRTQPLDSVPVTRVEVPSAQLPISIPFQLPEAGFVTLVIEGTFAVEER